MYRDHVWVYDFVQDRPQDGRVLRMLVDEYTRECLAIDVARRMTSEDVLERLAFLMATRALPEHIRSDNGAEFSSQTVREWLVKVGVKTLFIEPGSPWEKDYVACCTSLVRSGTNFENRRRSDSFVPWLLTGPLPSTGS